MANTNTPFEKGFGKFNKVVVVNNATANFTSSGNFGAAAVMIEGSATGTIKLFDGGSINIADLTAGVVYEFGPAEVTEGGSKDVYVLFR